MPDLVLLGDGDDVLYEGEGWMEQVDCGPGQDVVHIYFRGLGHAPYEIDIDSTGSLKDRLRNCETLIGDDVTHPDNPHHADVTADWTNAGARLAATRSPARGRPSDQLVFRLGAGPDVFLPNRFLVPPGRAVLVLGRGGDDRITGTPAGDHLEGESGGDVLDGQGGDDLLHGRTGDDAIHGRDGDDVLEGGRGADLLKGGDGADRLTGGFDRDRLYGGAGADRINALDGAADIVDCGPGRDTAIVDRRDTVRGCERIER